MVVAAVGMASAGHPVQAQALPQPAQPGTGLSGLFANPGDWMTAMFNAALVGLGQKTTSDVVGFMGWVLGSGNVISQTPPGLSYDGEAVGRLWAVMRVISPTPAWRW
jgi:hypothetical protein